MQEIRFGVDGRLLLAARSWSPPWPLLHVPFGAPHRAEPIGVAFSQVGKTIPADARFGVLVSEEADPDPVVAANKLIRVYDRASGSLCGEYLSTGARLTVPTRFSNTRLYYLVALDPDGDPAAADIRDNVSPTSLP